MRKKVIHLLVVWTGWLVPAGLLGILGLRDPAFIWLMIGWFPFMASIAYLESY